MKREEQNRIFDHIVQSRYASELAKPPAELWISIESSVTADPAFMDQLIAKKYASESIVPPSKLSKALLFKSNFVKWVYAKSLFIKIISISLSITFLSVIVYDYNNQEVIDTNEEINQKDLNEALVVENKKSEVLSDTIPIEQLESSTSVLPPKRLKLKNTEYSNDTVGLLERFDKLEREKISKLFNKNRLFNTEKRQSEVSDLIKLNKNEEADNNTFNISDNEISKAPNTVALQNEIQEAKSVMSDDFNNEVNEQGIGLVGNSFERKSDDNQGEHDFEKESKDVEEIKDINSLKESMESILDESNKMTLGDRMDSDNTSEKSNDEKKEIGSTKDIGTRVSRELDSLNNDENNLEEESKGSVADSTQISITDSIGDQTPNIIDTSIHSKKSNLNSRFELALMVTPYYANQLINTKNSNVEDFYKKNLSGQWQVTAEVSGFYYLDNKWAISLGAAMYSIKQEISLNNLRPEATPTIQLNALEQSIRVKSTLRDVSLTNLNAYQFGKQFIDNRTPNDLSKAENLYAFNFFELQEFNFVSIPFHINYIIQQGDKIRLVFSGGILASYLIQSESRIEIATVVNPDQKAIIEDYHATSKLGVSMSIRTGLDYQINSRLNFLFMPTMNYSITNLNKFKDNQLRPYFISFSIGFKYGF